MENRAGVGGTGGQGLDIQTYLFQNMLFQKACVFLVSFSSPPTDMPVYNITIPSDKVVVETLYLPLFIQTSMREEEEGGVGNIPFVYSA